MDKRIPAAGIKFPEYWDSEKAIDLLLNKHPDDLLTIFNCKNNQTFSKFINQYMPKRPAKMSVRQYIQEVLNGPMPETFAELQERKKREREYEQVNT